MRCSGMNVWLTAGLFFSIFTTVLIVSCSKDDEPYIPEVIVKEPSMEYFEEATGLDVVSASTIQLAMKIAGYPQFESYVKYSIKLYKIVYNTTYKGQPILASGIISYPVGISDSIPEMIVGNGLTFADRDAPSEFDLPDNFTGFEFIGAMGYLTLIPDMIGFGVSKDITFPIHNYEHSANTMIDFILAVDEFLEIKELPVKNSKLLTGYSQGAYIALSTLKMIEEKPVSRITIRATAVGAGAYNLVNMLDYAVEKNTYSAPSHLILLFSSYNEIYEWDRPMTDFFKNEYAAKIPELLNGMYDREEINDQLAYSFDSLMNPVFLNNLKTHNEPEIISALAENCIDDWAPKGRLNLIHSINDDRIPVTDSENTYNKMVANGAEKVTFTTLETFGHINAAIGFIEVALPWLSSYQ